MLEIAELTTPRPQPEEVLVRVHAASVNPKDTFIRKGRFELMTGNDFPLRVGFDFAGEVAELGSSVHTLSPGDPVYGMLDGWGGGACAEYVLARRHQLAPKPPSLSFSEAAALPLVALTALQALRDKARLQPGKRVCVNGASGGVGTMAVQIARIFGAAVTALASADTHPQLAELGADRCLDYHTVDITRSRERFDVFFDVFGNRRFREVKPILTSNGVWISTVLQRHVYRSVVWSKLFGRKKARLVLVAAAAADLMLLSQWVQEHRLRPVLHHIYPLEEIAKAHTQQESKHTHGKLVISLP